MSLLPLLYIGDTRAVLSAFGKVLSLHDVLIIIDRGLAMWSLLDCRMSVVILSMPGLVLFCS